MPVLNGLEATIALRNQDIDTPIYAISAENDDQKQQEFINSGCNGHASITSDYGRETARD